MSKVTLKPTWILEQYCTLSQLPLSFLKILGQLWCHSELWSLSYTSISSDMLYKFEVGTCIIFLKFVCTVLHCK